MVSMPDNTCLPYEPQCPMRSSGAVVNRMVDYTHIKVHLAIYVGHW